MKLFIFIFVVVSVACVVLNLKKIKSAISKNAKNAKGPRQEFAYQLREALFTPAEIKFYRELEQAIGEQFIIFGKVRVADIISPEKGLSKGNWRTAFNKISAKHFDFVLCNKNSLRVEVVIELDDKSHRKSNRVNRDKFLNRATKTAGLKIIRFPVKSLYSTNELQSKILQIMQQ